jgi:autotransporter-associated beta strand protein
VLLAANTYTGTTTVEAGTLQIGGAVSTFGSSASFASTSFLLNGGTLALDNLGVSNSSADRLSDSAVLQFQGGALIFRGSDQATTNSAETVGTLAFVRGISRVTTSFGSTNTAILTAAQLSRAAGEGIGFINGISLGKDSSSTASVSRLLLSTAPDLVGTTAALASGINGASRNTKIVPYLVGASDPGSGGSGTAATVPNTFLTYEAGTGLRPLNPTDEFSNNAIVSGDNIRATASTTTTASSSVNSVVIEGDGVILKVASGHTLTVDSGAILFSSGVSPRIDGPGTLNFGAREGIITINSTGNTFISAPISGSGGVTYHGTGTLVLSTQQNTYSGDTVLRVASVIPQASSVGPAGSPVSGSFGTGRLILDGSAIRSTTGGDITIGNEVVLRSDTTIPDTTGAKSLIFTGPVTLEGVGKTFFQNSSAATFFTGAIGDGGGGAGLQIAGNGTGAVILEGANTYSGGTVVETGTLLVNNLSGSGTGTGGVTVQSGGTLGGTGTISGATEVKSGGILSAGVPGASDGVGTLTFGGDLTTRSGSTWLVDLVEGVSGTADRVDVGGGLSLTGADLTIQFSGSFEPGKVYTIANYGTSLTGTFNGLSDGAFVDPGMQYFISYGALSGPGAITLTAVPEPGTIGILGIALSGILLRRRRRKSL